VDATKARTLLLNGAERDVFDRTVRLASVALRAPVATLGVADGERLILARQLGVPEPWRAAGQLPLEATYCRHILLAGEGFAVEDVARHPLGYSVSRLENFPRVAYCGAPVVVAGETVAVLSVSDTRPRRWTSEDLALVRDLAAGILRDVELMADEATDEVVPDAPPASMPDGVLTVDADWRFTFVSDRARSLLDLGNRVVDGLAFWDVFAGLVGSAFHYECLRVVADRTPCDLETYCNSARAWLEVRAWPLNDGGAALQLRDVTARRSELDRLRGQEARYRRLFEDSRTPAFVMTPESTLLETNSAFAELMGRPREDLVHARLSQLAADEDALGRLLDEFEQQGAVSETEVPFRHAGGEVRICAVSGTVHDGDNGRVFHGTMRDITAAKREQEELVRTALHDPLTGLPNRLVFMDRLERVLQHSRRRPTHGFAVLFLDLDNFKGVNDSLGHLAGDQLLVTVARRLESCIRQEDTVARIGGDEFAILLDIHEIAGITLVVDRIREALAEPFSAEGREAGCNASIGIAVALNNYERAEDLLRDADAAMYRAKSGGRNGYVIFDGQMHDRYLAQRQLEQDLREALARHQFDLHYHPEVRLDTGGVTGMEALVRWTHPERGTLLPEEFIPLAEQTGLIVDMGWWVLREACSQLKTWQQEYPDAAVRMTMSVNLSARQFAHPDLVAELDAILAETGVDPALLRLDLTEEVVMQHAPVATGLLRQLRDRGVQICIDDFGTGFTSISRLREFPVSTLKIDRSFVQRLGIDGTGGEIVQSILALGRSMAIEAIAEGVETPEQLAQLRRLGTRFAQGFLFSLPLDRAAAGALLQEA
jgi:diguanylate cyclase (GGDEF)-like protein/PAS domain S-box-containing protein